MAEDNSGATPQQEAVKANWEALSWLNESETVVEEAPITPEQEQLRDTPEGTPAPTEVKPEETKTEPVKEGEKPEGTKPETEAKPDETKPEGEKPAEELTLEFKPDDIEGAPKIYQDGTFQALAQEMGVELPEESFDAYKAAFVPKSELEKVRAQTKEALFSEITDANVAAALKLKELGIPDELVLEPTRNIDSSLKQIEQDLKLTNSELYRRELESRGYTAEQVDLKMQTLIDDNKLDAQADLLRFEINQVKEKLGADRQQILATKDTLIKQYTEQKQLAEIQKAEKEAAQVKEALSSMTDFLGVPLSKEAKEVLIRKLDSGAYNEDFKSSTFKAKYIVQKELGAKYADLMKNKFLSQGRDEYMKKLSNVPEVKSTAINRVDTSNQLDNNWAALEGFRQGN